MLKLGLPAHLTQILGCLICAGLALGVCAPVVAQDEAVALIIELLNDKDKDIRSLAFDQIRLEAKGEAATLKFAELLPTLAPETQVGLLGALAARGDAAATPSVRKLLTTTSDDAVKLAAIGALGSLGADTDVALLVSLLSVGSANQQAAVRQSLVRLSGESASSAIVAELKKAKTSQRVALIEILTSRRAGIAAILDAATDSDPAVRGAAMTALSEIATPQHVSDMLKGVLAAQAGRERIAAERAVTLVCVREPDASRRAEPVLKVMDSMSSSDRILLLPTLGRIGGAAALKEIEKAFSDSESKMHTAGLTALCNWPDGSIAPRLLELARTEPHPEHRKMALKALIRVAPLPDSRSDQRRLDLLRTILAMCETDADRNLVIQRASSIRTLETFRFVAGFLSQPTFAQQACESIVELAHHRGLREPNKAEFDSVLDQVIKISKDAVVVDRAQRYKAGQTWVRPKEKESKK